MNTTLTWRGRARTALLALLTLSTVLAVAIRPAGASAAPAIPAAAAAATPGFNGVTPSRLLDTRDGTGAPKGPVGPGGTIDLQVTGRGGVPASGVSAVVLNVTVTAPTASGWITVFPTGGAKPLASNLNFVPGQTVPNLVIAKVGTDGKVSLNSSAGQTQLVADVSGWYAAGSDLVPTQPVRLLDTRDGTGGVTGPTSGDKLVTVAGQAGVPASATSVVLNVTVTQPTADGWLTVWAETGAPRPDASNLNYLAGANVPNLVIAKIGSEGAIKYSNPHGTVQVVMDVLGYTTGRTPMTELLDAVDSTGSSSEGTAPVDGKTRFDSIRFSGICSANTVQWSEYNLGRQWKTLSTTVGFDDDRATTASKVRFRIYGDGNVLAEKTLSFGQVADLAVDVTNVLRVRLEVLNANTNGNPCSYGSTFGDVELSLDANAGFPAALQYSPLVPSRILDTRAGTGAGKARVGPGGVVELVVAGQGGVPDSGVGGVVLNLTVTNPSESGWFTAWPSGQPQPLASNVNFLAGQTVANLVIVPVGPNGRVSIANAHGLADMVADVLGWFPGTASVAPATVDMTQALNAVDSTGASSEAAVQLAGKARTDFLSFGGICSASTPQWSEYDLSRAWGTLATTVGFDDTKGTATSNVRFRVYGDGAVLAERTLSFGQTADLSLNVNGVLRVRFEVLNTNASGNPCSYGSVFGTPVLSR